MNIRQTKENGSMKKTTVALLILLGVAFSLPPAASAVAVALNNTAMTDAQFQTIAGNPILQSVAGQNVFMGSGTQGIIDSAAYTGAGAAVGLYVYTYRLTMISGDIFSMIVPFGGPANVAFSPFSFYLTGGLTAGSPLDQFYGSTGGNGSFAPDMAQISANDASGAFQTVWFSPITGGETSAIMGLISNVAPALVIADFVDGGKTLSSPLVVAPTPPAAPVPEPATLLLLGSGLSSLAAWGWRRKRGQ
jgi:hypothetical protein